MQSTRSTALAGTLRGACRIPSRTAASARRFTVCAVADSTPLPRVPYRPALRSHPCQLTQSRRYGSSASSSSSSSSSSSTSTTEPLRTTPLHSLHLAHKAKMVPFGGFQMPVQYDALGVRESHLFTRAHASLFDVSHMVQRVFSGPGAARFLQRVTPSGLEALPVHRSTLSCLLRDDGSGGIVDDCVITRLPGDRFYVVTNAACRDKDDAYLAREADKWNRSSPAADGWEVKEERWGLGGLIALQGPDAAGILAGVLEAGGLDLTQVLFGQSFFAKIRLAGGKVSSPVLVSRGGYTGEDGFEISIPAEEAIAVTEALLEAGGPDKVQLAGLGARDSLRLEAGMCLYGHDLDESTTPVEAGLSWIIPKERRTADAGFYGAEVISKQLVSPAKGGSGVARRRIGLIVEGAPAREGAEIVSRAEGSNDRIQLGVVTSGCPSPSLGKNIAMGYVKEGFHKAGTEVDVIVRGRPRKAVVTKMPFVPTKYWKGNA
ncbi:hypothetical protein MYCTH_2313750 [Thermothelomyces thermophilus ATCC 42464]|uniref:Aminomethyltransferase n=1 Tax=Thermothelomyces thermophilus (strain ATCC 42464 / BCRC 31852 / DSM 1799) TaxID=573729 RepID=G2Q2E9_THET4|nr:uncharacterized protein MYCTH_2313750 [Thermothelomyces thermophilus ATCC 42464]AEO54274.1 hypothetical protein MYCTH_2313750 [Thermothelomyces thermophilus ATCC 42464]